jgi:hypothetical protein
MGWSFADTPQMFERAIDMLKGWPRPHALDFVGKLDPATDATAKPVTSGRVVHVSANAPLGMQGKVESTFQLGAVGLAMPIFLFPGADDFDVFQDGRVQTKPHGYQTISPAGNLMGFVAVGAYEFQTTEFDQTDGVVYAPNDALHSPTEAQITGSDKSAAGFLFNKRNWPGGNNGAITQYVDHVCGIVSRGAVANHHRQQVITFWPVWLPGQDATH